jgi:hypothetical protein
MTHLPISVPLQGLIATFACASVLGTSMHAHAQPATGAALCAAPRPGAPMFVTENCLDPEFSTPVIDSRTHVSLPFSHVKISGHFKGTMAKFTIYLPEKETWQGRFHQTVYPMASADAADSALVFARDNGAFTVQTVSPGGYRIDAAAAKFAKKIARDYYDVPHQRIFGYIAGGSGGSYQTIGAIENTDGVWDGAVPFVIGVPTSIPNNFFVRAFARLILKDKAAQIADAVRPGGTGDPYAGLDPTERTVLAEVSALGVPLRGWDDYNYLLGLNDAEGLEGFRDTVRKMDPGYAGDFWRKPGYLGTEKSDLGDRVRAARVMQTTTIGAIARDKTGVPTGFVLSNRAIPDRGFFFDVTLVDAAGGRIATLAGKFNAATNVFTLAGDNKTAVLAAVQSGAKVQLDNDWAVALTSLHRHQVPIDPSFTAWQQFRDADGKPIYPQRAVLVGPQISLSVTGGAAHTGKINGKVIAISNLLDVDAYPWHGDWYAKLVKVQGGPSAKANFRLWLNDNADHLDGHVIASGTTDTRTVRLINYTGILQQAILDVSAWVEKGILPPPSTAYKVDNGQVSLAGRLGAHGGTQPDVQIRAGGAVEIEVAVGEPVTLQGAVKSQPGTGFITKAEWSQYGNDQFTTASLSDLPRDSVSISTIVTYAQPGIFYPVLRVSATREATPSSGSTRSDNLARMRIIVK